MNISTLLLIIVFLFFLYYIYTTYIRPSDDHKVIVSQHPGNTEHVEAGLYGSDAIASYTHSFWILINSMNQSNSERAVIKKHASTDVNKVEFRAYLKPTSNDLVIEKTINGIVNNDCVVTNFPLQKWVSVVISVQDSTTDVYIDGKLVRSCVGNGSLTPVLGANLTLGGVGSNGFSGYLNRVEYFKRSLSPSEAYAIYRRGPGEDMLSTNYKVKLNVLRDNSLLKSYEF